MTGAPAPFRGSEPFLRLAPPLSVPLRHFACAGAAFLVFAAGVALGAPRLVGFGFEAKFALGLVHVLTLGWVAQTVLGAWTQMIPAHGETPLVSLGAVKAGWWLFLAGAVAFVGALWAGSERYWLAAAAAYAGVLVELGALAVTHARAVKRDWTWTHFAAAFVWLALLGLVGTLMAVDRHRATVFPDPEGGLISHAHMALAGFAGTTVYGAGYRLFPWVALQQLRSRLPGRLSFYLLQAGLAGLSLDMLFFGRRLTWLWAVLLAASYLLYFAQLKPMLSTGPALDPSLAALLLGAAGGAGWVGWGVGLATGAVLDEPAARAAYVWLALVGFFTPVILSQVHKIAPFLVWLHVYSPRQWTPPVSVPKIDDLTSRSLAWVETFALALAAPLGAAGLARGSEGMVRAAGALLLLCAAAYALNTAALLRHVLRPDGRWTRPGQSGRAT